ncbi:MAG: hypothetical protein ABI352_09545 [Candidatus Dormibacter sp.]
MTNDRTLFQGDIFDAVPAQRYPLREGEQPLEPRARKGYVMVLGHPCEISADEKGANLPWRLVCPVVPDTARRLTVDGDGDYYAFPLPSLVVEEDLWYADFRFLATVAVSYFDPKLRKAGLSEEGWHALQRRLIHFLTRITPDWLDLEDAGVGLHPDSATAGSELV